MRALLRTIAWTLAIALVAAPIFAVLNGWIGGERWPMRRLAVHGEFRQVSEQAVREAVLPHVGGGFFAVDLAEVQEAVARLPWVATVQARKRWPDRLEVAISEHTPVARWGDDRLLAESGALFAKPVQVPEGLPLFIGSEERRTEVLDFYRASRPLFLPMGLQVNDVELNARGGWRLRLSDGADIEVGRDMTQQRLQRFARYLPRLRDEQQRPLLRADLRYTNGFALTWGTAPAPAPAPHGSENESQG